MSNAPLGLLDLPDEILQKVFVEVPNELKKTCRTFVVMYNDHYMNLFIERFGLQTLEKIKKADYKYIIDYIKSFDYWRRTSRKIIANYYNLKDSDENDVLNVNYIRDSWQLVYSIYMNRRIPIDHKPRLPQDPFSWETSAHTSHRVKLVPGFYNFSVGICIRDDNLFQQSQFIVSNATPIETLMIYQPVSHFTDIVEKNKLIALDLGDFEVKRSRFSELFNKDGSKLVDIDLIIKETTNQNLGYTIFYLDVNAYPMKECEAVDNRVRLWNDVPVNNTLRLINQKYWMAWWIENQKPECENVINYLLERVYESIQNTFNGVAAAEYKEPDVDISTYNKAFYSIYIDNGDLIRRTFKFITNKDRIRYNKWLETRGDVRKLTDNEPLTWKLHPIQEL